MYLCRMEELIPILKQYIKSREKPGGFVVFVAHNARSFDVPFLAKEFSRCCEKIPPNWLFLDTLPLAREMVKSGGESINLFIFCIFDVDCSMFWYWQCQQAWSLLQDYRCKLYVNTMVFRQLVQLTEPCQTWSSCRWFFKDWLLTWSYQSLA